MTKRRFKKIICSALAMVMITGLSMTAFADSSTTMTFDEAKEYLRTYNVTQTNSMGKEYTTQYIFKSEQDLNEAAEYIVDNGLDAFNAAITEAITDTVSKEPQTTSSIARTTKPSTAYASVSGNGSHSVSTKAYGLASFDTLGTVEYSVELGYKVTVKNGKISNISSISFDIPYISAAGSWGKTSFQSYRKDSNCGVTANYVITKTVEIAVGRFSVEIKSETDNEVFALITNLK